MWVTARSYPLKCWRAFDWCLFENLNESKMALMFYKRTNMKWDCCYFFRSFLLRFLLCLRRWVFYNNITPQVGSLGSYGVISGWGRDFQDKFSNRLSVFSRKKSPQRLESLHFSLAITHHHKNDILLIFNSRVFYRKTLSVLIYMTVTRCRNVKARRENGI